MDVVWQAQALSDRQAIIAELAVQAPQIALDWDRELEAKLAYAVANLASLPTGRVPGTLELVLLPHYVLVLQPPTATAPLVVLRLLHISKPWP